MVVLSFGRPQYFTMYFFASRQVLKAFLKAVCCSARTAALARSAARPARRGGLLLLGAAAGDHGAGGRAYAAPSPASSLAISSISAPGGGAAHGRASRPRPCRTAQSAAAGPGPAAEPLVPASGLRKDPAGVLDGPRVAVRLVLGLRRGVLAGRRRDVDPERRREALLRGRGGTPAGGGAVCAPSRSESETMRAAVERARACFRVMSIPWRSRLPGIRGGHRRAGAEDGHRDPVASDGDRGATSVSSIRKENARPTRNPAGSAYRSPAGGS